MFEFNKVDALYWAEKFELEITSIPAKTMLLSEGQKSGKLYLIKQGCIRLWINNNGKDITNQFFFEGTLVASLESFLTNRPSDYFLETIEKSDVYILDKNQFESLLSIHPDFKAWFQQYITERFLYYSKHVLSFLRDKPEIRYQNLLLKNPQIIQRVAQHYIASYLGITAVSLSRIRNKISTVTK